MDALTGPVGGALCALGSAFTWAITSLLVRTLAPVANSVAVNAIRSSVGGALLLGWIVLRGEAAALTAMSAQSFGLLAISIVVAVVVGDNLFFESIQSLGLARAMTISMTYPLVTTALAGAVLDEAITPPVVAGSLLTLAGVMVIIAARGEDGERPERWWFGLGAAALAALAWGITPILMKAPLREMDATTAQAIRLPIAAAVLWVMPWTRGALTRLRSGGHPALVRMAVVSALTAVSSVLFVAGLKYTGVAVATVLSSTAPMFAIPLGFVFLGERLSRGAIVGTLVTVLGIAVLQIPP
jgi:DME family drug/metabolite transporter